MSEGACAGRFRRRRKDGADSRWWDVVDFPDVFGDSPLVGLAIFVGVIVFVLLMVFVIGPLALALFDLVIWFVFLIGGLAGRLLFRRPWTVEAVADDGVTIEQTAVGLGASRQSQHQLAERIRTGLPPG